MNDRSELIEALRKKALGNEITTINEEYGQNEKGELILVKKTQKTTKNDIDTTALIKLLEIEEKKHEDELNELRNKTDAELEEMAYICAKEIMKERRKNNK